MNVDQSEQRGRENSLHLLLRTAQGFLPLLMCRVQAVRRCGAGRIRRCARSETFSVLELVTLDILKLNWSFNTSNVTSSNTEKVQSLVGDTY